MKKPWYKRWWVWVLAILVVWFGIIVVRDPQDAKAFPLLIVSVFLLGFLPILGKRGEAYLKRKMKREPGGERR
jgi:CDP-diglyceride synthetase